MFNLDPPNPNARFKLLSKEKGYKTIFMPGVAGATPAPQLTMDIGVLLGEIDGHGR